MGKSYTSSGTFDPAELRMLSGVYHDVCQRVVQDGHMALTTQVRETIAVAIFNLAGAGVRDHEQLWCGAMREIEAFHGVQRSLSEMAAGAVVS
jgi:hypothetical protein